MQLHPLQTPMERVENSAVPMELVLRVKEDFQKNPDMAAITEQYGEAVVKQVLGRVKNEEPKKNASGLLGKEKWVMFQYAKANLSEEQIAKILAKDPQSKASYAEALEFVEGVVAMDNSGTKKNSITEASYVKLKDGTVADVIRLEGDGMATIRKTGMRVSTVPLKSLTEISEDEFMFPVKHGLKP